MQRAAVSLALWHGQVADALTVARREWPRVLDTDEPGQIALAASTCLEAAAEAAEAGRARRDVGLVAQATELAALVLPEAERQVAAGSLPATLGARTEADLHLGMARAHERRVRGRASARTWATLAEAWVLRGLPYQAAKARWWQALAELGRVGSDRTAARDSLQEAWRLASRLPAGPLCAALRDLASRARIPLPLDEGYPAPAIVPRRPDRVAFQRVAIPVLADDGDPGTGAGMRGSIADVVRAPERSLMPFGLSRRELEVLLVICEGRTDREIAERLFISERTVHVHVRKVLHKLGVGSRTHAATIAFQAGLVPQAPDAVRSRT